MKIDFFTVLFLTLINIFPTKTFHMPRKNIHLEGTVSQILDIGPRLYFMKSRNIIMNK